MSGLGKVALIGFLARALQIGELLGGERAAALELARDRDLAARRLGLGRAAPMRLRLDDLADEAEAVDEIGERPEEGAAPELAVGHDVDAGRLLLRHRLVDRAVLDLLERRHGHLALGQRLARLLEPLGAQQRADHFGAVDRGHGGPLLAGARAEWGGHHPEARGDVQPNNRGVRRLPRMTAGTGAVRASRRRLRRLLSMRKTFNCKTSPRPEERAKPASRRTGRVSP